MGRGEGGGSAQTVHREQTSGLGHASPLGWDGGGGRYERGVGAADMLGVPEVIPFPTMCVCCALLCPPVLASRTSCCRTWRTKRWRCIGRTIGWQHCGPTVTRQRQSSPTTATWWVGSATPHCVWNFQFFWKHFCKSLFRTQSTGCACDVARAVLPSQPSRGLGCGGVLSGQLAGSACVFGGREALLGHGGVGVVGCGLLPVAALLRSQLLCQLPPGVPVTDDYYC